MAHVETKSSGTTLRVDRDVAKFTTKRSASAALKDRSETGRIKRPRVNTAKQGRPSHLSISQRRKLVRLYIYTDLPLDDIRTLIEHYGPKKMQTRALQYILKSLLHENYSQLRPKGHDVEQDRIIQAQKCKDLTRNGSQRPEGSEALIFSSHPAILRTEDSRKDTSPKEHEVSAALSHEIIPAVLSSAQLTRNDKHTNEIYHDSNIVVSAASTTPAVLPTTTTDLGDFWLGEDSSTLLLSSDEVFMPLHEFLDVCDDPFMGAPADESFWSEQLPKGCNSTGQRAISIHPQHSMPRDIETSTTGSLIDFSNPNITNDESMRLQSGSLSFIDTHLNPQPFVEIREPEVEKLSGHYPRDHLLNRTKRHSDYSLSALLDDQVNYSNDDIKTIRTILTQFSASTGSSHGRSTTSIMSEQDCRERSVKPLGRVDRGDYIDHVEILRRRETELLQHYRVDATELRNEEDGAWCTIRLHCDKFPSRRTADDSCADPDPLSDYFRFNENNTWSDRYGNTGLHVAAVLGACYNTHLNLTRYGVDVHRANVAGQTFLHVYNEFSFEVDPNEGILLVRELISRNFDFNRRDAYGRGIYTPLSLIVGVVQAGIPLPSSFSYRKANFNQFANGIREFWSSAEVERMFQAIADLNCRDEFQDTLLHHSIRTGSILITRAVLKKNPNLHAINSDGNGVLAEGERALRQAKSDAGLYARITACMSMAIDAGAVAYPSWAQEATFRPKYTSPGETKES